MDVDHIKKTNEQENFYLIYKIKLKDKYKEKISFSLSPVMMLT